MKITSIAIGAFALLILLTVTCIMATPDSSADPIVQTDGGLTYTLTEGGGDKYYAEVTAYDGTTSDIVIKSVYTNDGTDYQVVSISENIFKNTGVQTVVIQPNEHLSLTSGMFSECNSLKTVSIGEGFKEIPTLFCYKCSNLTTVAIPSSIESIGESAFAYCIKLESVSLSENLTTIMGSAFQGCQTLQTVTIPDSVTKMGLRVFSQCYELSSVTLGANLTIIPATAFGSTKITSITIPSKVTTIELGDGGDTETFPTCLESIVVSEDNEVFESKSGILYKKADGALYYLPKSIGGEITFYTDVTANMCNGNTKITKVTIADGVKSIGNMAFNNCTSLEEVYIADSVTSVGFMTFAGNTSLVNVHWSKSVSAIPMHAFRGCKNLEEINLDNVTVINNNAFQDCSKLAITALPANLETIGNSAFLRCSALNISGLPASVKSIGTGAFKDTGIVEIALGQNSTVVSISGSNSYQPFGGTSLKSICFNNASSKSSLEEIIDLSVSSNLETVKFGEKFALSGFVDKSIDSLSKAFSSKVILAVHLPYETSLEIVPKDTTKELQAPAEIENMKFIGWFADQAYEVPYDDSDALTANVHVYAKFKYNKVTVDLVVGDEVKDSFDNLSTGDVVTLRAETVENKIFNGWMINGLLLGAQYIVSCDDADDSGKVVLTASFSDKPAEVNNYWALTVVLDSGTEGKAFWTKTNAIGTYGMITVLPDEFEKASFEVSENGGYGIISDTCAMVYSNDGKDVSVTVKFSDVGKASDYTVSLVEIVKDNAPGFRATVSADEGYVDTDGTFSIRYVYKVYDEENQVWAFTTSGQTTGVEDAVIALGTEKASKITGDFVLDVDGAYLVYGYASYSFKDESAGATVTEVVTSPVIMSVSEIQAVTKP